MTTRDRVLKRALDITISAGVLAGTSWLIGLAVIAATLDTGRFGLFRQVRVGRNGTRFFLYKVRTMRPQAGTDTTVTTSADPRVTTLGRWLRRFKVDELPQFFNVLIGDMSLVGPRPDVPGFADRLRGPERAILTIRPGITGPATLRFRDEEALLAGVPDPERYNREVIYPEKVRLNLEYIASYRPSTDLGILLETVRCLWSSSPRNLD